MRGLMFQDQLPYDQGMIFIFDEPGLYSLWMLNMQFPLDMMWFDENGQIVGNGLPITPQIAASGLWSTPSDMATFVIEIQNALRNKNNTVISNKVAKRVTAI